MPMQREQIKQKLEKLNEQLDSAQEKVEQIKLNIEFLQRQCKHPNMKSYGDYGGGRSSYCEDCGYGY